MFKIVERNTGQTMESALDSTYILNTFVNAGYNSDYYKVVRVFRDGSEIEVAIKNVFVKGLGL